MAVYYFLFAVILLQMILEPIAKKYKFEEKSPFWYDLIFKEKYLICFLFILFATIRGNSVGGDNGNYIKYYNACKNGEYIFDFEIGYGYLNIILAKLGLPINALWLVIAFFTMYAFKKLIDTYCKDSQYIPYLLFLSLGLYAQMLGLYRQIIALDFCLLGLCSLKNNKYFEFVWFVLMSSMFHLSGLLGFVFLIPKIIKFDFRTCIISFLILTILGVFFIEFLQLLEMIIPNFRYYSQYVEQNPLYGGYFLDIPYTIGLAGILVFLIIIYFGYKNKYSKEEYKNFSYFLILYIIYFYTKLLGVAYGFEALFNRISIMFYFSIIILPTFVEKAIGRFRLRKWYQIAIIIVAFCYMTYLIKYKGSCMVYPYEFMWN